MLPLAAAAAAFLGTAYAYDTSLPTVDLGYQVYRASSFNASGNFYSFSNIRYAAPPVGELRFALPQPPVRNRSAINNGDLSRMCPQGVPGWFAITEPAMISQSLEPLFTNTTYVAPGANASSPMPPPNPRESEDCLFLDVAVPKHIFERAAKPSKQAGAPVLVWIHGGGFTIGEKTNNPAGLLAASGTKTQGDIIYVSFNYRLGAFGYLSGPSFQAEGGVSNLGFYDQRMALEWVQKNIHLFGGDKNRVTIFGESAGGGSVIHHLTAYGGFKGPVPFQQAIPQSGGWIPYGSSVLQEDKYRKFLSLTNATSLAQLRALPSEALIRTNAQQVRYDSSYGTFTFGAAVDGIFAPLQPNQLIAQGRFDKNVRVMIGYNSLEGGPFVPFTIKSEAEIRKYVKSIYEATPDSSINHILENLYPPVFDGSLGYTNNLERALLLVSEGPLTCHTWSLGQAYENKTYAYLFAVPPGLHGQDLWYTYHDGGASPFVKNATVAFALQQLITSFAKTGVPKATGVDQFNMYGPDENVLELNITGFRQIPDSNVAARCAWWSKALF